MWKFLYSFPLLPALAACDGRPIEILPADDLNHFNQGAKERIFAVKEGWFEKAHCADFEGWAKTA